MRPFQAWLRHADPRARALILPDASVLSFGDLARVPGRSGLHVPVEDATTIALAFAASAVGGGTAFPLPTGLDDEHRQRLLDLAEEAATPSLALIIATSGSEGTPKAVRLPWRAVAAAALMSGRALDLRPGDVWLACLPLRHIGGAMIPYRCWRAGATALIHEGFDVEAVMRDLHDRRVSHVSLVPPMLARLLDLGAPPSSLRHAIVGGAALTEALLGRARAADWPVATSYGMTETCAMAALDGHPLPGVRMRVGESGTIEIASPARMAGYLGQPDSGDWFATRDLGAMAADGRVTVTGRADEMLVTGGANVHPIEVEARLAACPGIREAGVTGLADPVWGDIIAAVYEGDAHEAAVESWCRAHLSGPRRPRRFLRVDRLPRTASGKLDRRQLARLASPTPT